MKTWLKIIGGAIVVIAVAFFGWQYLQKRRASQAGLLTEDITHQGDVWKADFTARIPAPEETVFDTMRQVENARNDHVKAVRIVSQNGNSKIVQMDFTGFVGQAMTVEFEFKYFPQQRKITYRTISSPMMDVQGEYDLTPEGAGTLIGYRETMRRVPNQFPDAVVKQAIRVIFLAQLEGLQKALHVASGGEENAADEEPQF